MIGDDQMEQLVSIIVPVYNVDKYLKECVDSILQQTYNHIEVILVDDGSTDTSGDICDQYSVYDDRVKVIHKLNGGLSDARNVGLEHAAGEYIYFCDSDDFIDYDMIEQALGYSVSNKADFVFFDAIPFSDEGIPYNNKAYKRNRQYNVATGKETGVRELVMDEYMPCIPLYMYKKDFLSKYKLTFRRGIIGEDELFSFWAYLYAERVAYIPRRFYHRRLRKGSIMTTTGNTKRKFNDYFLIYQEMKNEFDKDKKCTFVREYMVRIVKSALLVYSKLNTSEKLSFHEAYKELKKDIIQNRGFGDPSLVIRLWSKYVGIGISGIRKYVRMKTYE